MVERLVGRREGIAGGVLLTLVLITVAIALHHSATSGTPAPRTSASPRASASVNSRPSAAARKPSSTAVPPVIVVVPPLRGERGPQGDPGRVVIVNTTPSAGRASPSPRASRSPSPSPSPLICVLGTCPPMPLKAYVVAAGTTPTDPTGGLLSYGVLGIVVVCLITGVLVPGYLFKREAAELDRLRKQMDEIAPAMAESARANRESAEALKNLASRRVR